MLKSLMYASLALALTTSAVNAANKSITIVNNSSHTIIQVQASNVNSDDWGENLISDSIAPGYQENVDLEDGARGCYYDLKITQRSGFTVDRRNLNACQLETFTVTD